MKITAKFCWHLQMIVITNTENDTLPAKCDVHPWARAVGRTVGSEYQSNIRTQKQFGKKRNCESIKAQFRWLQKGWVCPGQAGGPDCPLHCGHVRDGWWLCGEMWEPRYCQSADRAVSTIMHLHIIPTSAPSRFYICHQHCPDVLPLPSCSLNLGKRMIFSVR